MTLIRSKPTTGGGRPDLYRAKSGERVPGVTSVISRFKESSGLVHWAWKLGLEGKDYRKKRDEAAGIGHLAHAYVDAEIHGRPFESVEIPKDATADDLAKAAKALEAYREWRDVYDVEIVDTETAVVSEAHGFGGTWDAIARTRKHRRLFLLDWKSSNAVYREYILQVAAYRELARQHGYDLSAASLVRFGKTHADFQHHSWPGSVLDIGWEAFRHALELYRLDEKLQCVLK